MELIRFLCKSCGERLRSTSDKCGKRAKCKHCGSFFTVPSQPSADDDEPVKAVNNRRRLKSETTKRRRSRTLEKAALPIFKITGTLFAVVLFAVLAVWGLQFAREKGTDNPVVSTNNDKVTQTNFESIAPRQSLQQLEAVFGKARILSNSELIEMIVATGDAGKFGSLNQRVRHEKERDFRRHDILFWSRWDNGRTSIMAGFSGTVEDSECSSALFVVFGEKGQNPTQTWYYGNWPHKGPTIEETPDQYITRLVKYLRTSHSNDKLLDTVRRICSVRPISSRRREVAGALESKLSNPELTYWTASALMDWGGPDNVPALIGHLYDSKGNPYETVVKALGAFGDPRAIEPLVAAFAKFPSQFAGLPSQIEVALEKFGSTPEAALWAHLQNPDERVCGDTCRLLGKIGTKASIPALLKVAESRTGEVAKQARKAITSVENRPKASKP